MKGFSSFIAPISKRLQGKVTLITGGASGIGEATARFFTQYGAKVVIADIQDQLGHLLCKQLGTEETISYAHCDVTKEIDIENAVHMATTKYGKLDIMFNNAGIAGKNPCLMQNGDISNPEVLNTDIEDFKKVFDVNVHGAFLGAKHAAKVMIPAKQGSIIFTSSVASVIAGDTPHAYTASKHAVVGLTKNLCVELGKYGIRVNCISPFAIPTPLLMRTLGMDAIKTEEVVYRSTNLKGTMVSAEDVAEAAVYLGSDKSKYVSGLNLVVDGGYSASSPAFGMALKASVT